MNVAACAPVRVPASQHGGPRTICAESLLQCTADKQHHTASSGPASSPVRLASEVLSHPNRESVGRMTAQRLPMFPLSAVLFPYGQMPLHIFEPRYQALVLDCLAADARFGIVLIERGTEVGGGDQRMAVGTCAVISKAIPLENGRWLLLVTGDSRIRVETWLSDDPYPLALVEEWTPDVEAVDPGRLHQAVQTVRRTRGLLSESGDAAALSADVVFDPDPDIASWQLCAQAPLNMIDAQRVLTASGTAERIELIVEFTESLEQDLHRMFSSG